MADSQGPPTKNGDWPGRDGEMRLQALRVYQSDPNLFLRLGYNVYDDTDINRLNETLRWAEKSV